MGTALVKRISGETKKVVIGEGMAAVKDVARKHNAKWYQAWKKNFEPMVTNKPKVLKLNEQWITTKINKGYYILDIGIDPQRRRRSEFYATEKRVIKKHDYPCQPIERPKL
mgnify:CR=1 FL=1